jgi:probable rRNA maturation factor
MPVKFADNNVKSRLEAKRKLSAFISNNILKQCQKRCNLQYVFVSDEELLAYNQGFLQHDTLTDIITFDLSENNKTIVGEIYISVDRVADNAKKFKVEYLQELHRVIFHGALHLCGFGDKKPADKKVMRSMEDKWLDLYAKEV